MHICRTNPDRQFTLIFGVRYEHSFCTGPNLNKWPGAPEFPFPADPEPTGRELERVTGHVQKHVLDTLGDRKDMDVYICGLKAMVDDVRVKLKELGLDRKQIIFEKYD